jgi:hypothetical protein
VSFSGLSINEAFRKLMVSYVVMEKPLSPRRRRLAKVWVLGSHAASVTAGPSEKGIQLDDERSIESWVSADLGIRLEDEMEAPTIDAEGKRL